MPDPLNPQQYKNPAGGLESTIGNQAVTEYYQKQALIEARKEQFFSQLADVTAMPKNMGKKIVRYHYIPMLDDANINDQGIDAAGVTISSAKWYATLPGLVFSFGVEASATAAAAAINALGAGLAVKTGTAAPWTVTVQSTNLPGGTQVQATAVSVALPGTYVAQGSGNLYGSSKDIGTIPSKMPLLSETGGRVNRVGFKRKMIEGTFEQYGIFTEYTQDALDFDSDADLWQHINREMINGASEMTEDLLQMDLINAAGVIRYAGDAVSNRTITNTSEVTYADLLRLAIDLTNNRTPTSTKMVTGTRLVDTKTIQGGRALYIGSELIPLLEAMENLHGDAAFISIEKYAAGADTLIGEIGSVGQFRIIVVPEMMHWEGGGAAVVGGDGAHYDNGTNYNVYPMLCIGSESFTTIGFQTDGKTVKFKIIAKKPGDETADRNDPYGKMGFMSIQFWYGFMVLRPERIGLIKTVATL